MMRDSRELRDGGLREGGGRGKVGGLRGEARGWGLEAGG